MTIGNEEEITTTFPERDGFDDKINEVMTMLTDSENVNMSPSNFKTLLGSLVETVNQESRTSEEHSEKMSRVGNLVNVFMHENAQRAQKTMDDRKPKFNPVLEQNKKVESRLEAKYNNEFTTQTEANIQELPDYVDKDDSNVTGEIEELETTTILDVEETTTASEQLKQSLDTTVQFSDILELSEHKDRMENHIVDMIVDDPGHAADMLSDLFIHQSLEEKLETKIELEELMQKDPMAVGAAFSDLITRQNISLGDENQPQVQHGQGKHSALRPIKAPPKEVQGQLLRIWSDQEVERLTERPKTRIRINPVSHTTEANVKTGKPHSKNSKLPSDVLDSMLSLIQTGEMSSRDVIEEMINNGMLPVEVTDIGKLPISVGSSKDREAISLTRLQQLRIKEPSIVMKDDRHEMVDVGLDDPDFDVENLGDDDSFVEDFGPIRTHGNLEIESVALEEEKDIDVESSLIKLNEQGLIDDDELKEMMEIMDLLPESKPEPQAGNKDRNTPITVNSNKENKRPIYKPPPISNIRRPIGNIRPQNQYSSSGTYGNKHIGSAIDFKSQPPPHYKPRLKLPDGENPSSYSYFEIQLGKHRGHPINKMRSPPTFAPSYQTQTSPYLPQDFEKAPRAIKDKAPLKQRPSRPKKHIKPKKTHNDNHFSSPSKLKGPHYHPETTTFRSVPPIHEEPFFEALKLENPFKDEFDDDFDFESGAPSFIPNFDDIEVDFNYDDYDPYSTSVIHNPGSLNFKEDKKSQELNVLPKLFKDNHGASVLVAPPPQQIQYPFRKLPENRELPYPIPPKHTPDRFHSSRPDLYGKRPYSHSETPEKYHPFKTSYKESFSNYGKKRLEFNPLLTPNYEETLVKDPERVTPRRKKKHLPTRTHYQEKAVPQYIDESFKNTDVPDYNNEYTLRGSAELEGPSEYNSPREPFGPPAGIRENLPFLKSQDYGRDVLRFSSRSDGHHDIGGRFSGENMYGYSEDFDPFKELEKEGVQLFGAPFESNTEGPTFSDFEFQKRSGHTYRPKDLYATATESSKGNNKREKQGPKSRSLGESPSYLRARRRRGKHGLTQNDGIASYTTIRPFAYTTSPEVGIELGNENIRRIHKSFIFGEKSNADF